MFMWPNIILFPPGRIVSDTGRYRHQGNGLCGICRRFNMQKAERPSENGWTGNRPDGGTFGFCSRAIFTPAK